MTKQYTRLSSTEVKAWFFTWAPLHSQVKRAGDNLKKPHLHSWKYFLIITVATLSSPSNFTTPEPIAPFPKAFSWGLAWAGPVGNTVAVERHQLQLNMFSPPPAWQRGSIFASQTLSYTHTCHCMSYKINHYKSTRFTADGDTDQQPAGTSPAPFWLHIWTSRPVSETHTWHQPTRPLAWRPPSQHRWDQHLELLSPCSTFTLLSQVSRL